VLDYDLDDETNILLLNTGLEEEKSKENVQVQLNAADYSQFQKSGRDNLLERAQHIVMRMEGKGVVFVRDGVHDHVCAYLRKNGIGVVRRVPESVMKALRGCLGISVAQTPEELEAAAFVKISRQKHNDVQYIFVESIVESDQSTLVLRGATQSTLDEVERGFDDALGVVSLVKEDGKVVAGGGSSFVAMASYLRNHGASVGGRPQMAIEAFADALEVIPATIAENAGHDPLDVVLAMRHEIQNGNLYHGPDVTDGGITNMRDAGIFEPTKLIKQAVLSATEVTTALLRIDDIVGRRPVE
jgi:chaperonin GroEL (HSP60 family)